MRRASWPTPRAAGRRVVAALLGPAPAPLTKLRGEHRAQFFLKSTSRKAMREALQLALSRKPSLAKRISIDVDPLSML